MIKHFLIALNLALIFWISRASFTHFNTSKKEPLAMLFVRVLTPLGVVWNLYVAYKSDDTTFALAIYAFFTAISCFVFALAIRETKGVNLPVAFTYDETTEYVKTGIYKHIRHPFYASYIAYWISWAVLNHKSVLSLLISVVLIVTYVVAVVSEEKYLNDTYNEKYREQKRSTARFLPYIY